MSYKNKYSNPFLLPLLIIFSFIFIIPSVNPIENHNDGTQKISQIKSSTNLAVIKSTNETKLIKRISILESDLSKSQYSLSALAKHLESSFIPEKFLLVQLHI